MLNVKLLVHHVTSRLYKVNLARKGSVRVSKRLFIVFFYFSFFYRKPLKSLFHSEITVTLGVSVVVIKHRKYL